MFEPKITETVQNIVKDYVEEGDYVIDATVGNGFDTVFLAENVGEDGRVYGFDIQDIAIKLTKEKLNERNISDRVILIEDSHENVLKHIEKPIKVAMFNLGYLPKGDKKLITKPDSTIKAIEDILRLITQGGIISIISYYGHEGGMEEKNSVSQYLGELDSKKFDVISISYQNRKMNPPIIYIIRKK